MKIHVLIDFMHIYYKYYFQYREGKLKKLTAPMELNGSTIEKDVTLIYHPLRDIENIRKNLECLGHDVTTSICFDMPSVRKDMNAEGSNEYKSGRKGLKEEDFININKIKEMLESAGHNTYRVEGYEADDIVNYLVRKYKDTFDYSVIYTNDKDLLINICENVGVMRFKQYKGYTQVDMNNYEQYLESEFGVFIPYNSLGLFLSTAGDSADKIKGIHKFGKVAFKKLITKVSAKNSINWKECGDYDKLADILPLCKEFLTDEQYKEMTNSFTLVANLEILDDLDEPTKKSTKQLREQTYIQYKMLSLIP